MPTQSIRTHIESEMRLKSTNELVEIWVRNNRGDWTDDAFEGIREILQERLDTLPEQDKPNMKRTDIIGDDLSRFLKSTSFLTNWLLFVFTGLLLMGLFLIHLFYGEEAPSGSIALLFTLTLPVLITSSVFMISRREVARPGLPSIKGWVAVLQGIIFTAILSLIEIGLIAYFFFQLFNQ